MFHFHFLTPSEVRRQMQVQVSGPHAALCLDRLELSGYNKPRRSCRGSALVLQEDGAPVVHGGLNLPESEVNQ